MSWQECDDPVAATRGGSALDVAIVPRARDLGGFEVRRVLPSIRRRSVGPFIFWDQMGPAVFAPGTGIDVRPHPHIGLATVTYLFRGEIMHRDSLGTVIAIRPGEMNLMSAGRGIVHSERTPDDVRAAGHTLHGIQAWVALPLDFEEGAPSFTHFAAAQLPLIESNGLALRLIVGEAFGVTSPVTLPMPMIYADAELAAGAVLPFDTRCTERAIYTVEGEVELDGQRFGPAQLLVLREGVPAQLTAVTRARCMLLGGAPLDAPRHLFWNFVSSSTARIEQAKADWTAGRFAAVPGDLEFIPLP
jgi:redox-sensitive bicupin YhaK (pirin superfamily)